MRAFLTGATGFIGGRLARKLLERSDEVVALVRSPVKATALAALGCELVEGDLRDQQTLRRFMDGCDSVFHGAAIYRVGIPASDRPSMYETNVTGTEHVLDAAVEAGVRRIVYISTVNVFGNTGGEVVDESYRRDTTSGFVSYYDETKYLAHLVAEDRISTGAPIIVVQPGAVYGPGDHSDVGNMIEQVRSGKMRFLMFPRLGLNLVYVDDVVEGIVLAHDKGRIGESYVLGGEIATMGHLFRRVAALEGRKAPKIEMPISLMKLATPIGPLVARVMKSEPNLEEIIRAADGVTYWATDARARRELGYAPRGLDEGLRQTLAASRR